MPPVLAAQAVVQLVLRWCDQPFTFLEFHPFDTAQEPVQAICMVSNDRPNRIKSTEVSLKALVRLLARIVARADHAMAEAPEDQKPCC